MSPPHGYVAIPATPSSDDGSTPQLLADEKDPSRFAWIYAPQQPVQLPLSTDEVELRHKQHKACVRRRLLKTFLFVFAASLLLFTFHSGSGLRSGHGCGRHHLAHVGVHTQEDFPGSPAETVTSDEYMTSHLHIYRQSGSIQGEYLLKPGLGKDVLVGEETAADAGEMEHRPRDYSTSAHLWTQSGSIQVGIKVVEEDDDDDDDLLERKRPSGTLLTIGSKSGSVAVRLHSRPSSSPVHFNVRSNSGSVGVFLPSEFAGPFRIYHRSGSVQFKGTLQDRAVIENDVDNYLSGWLYSADDFQRRAARDDSKESLMISTESGSVAVDDA